MGEIDVFFSHSPGRSPLVGVSVQAADQMIRHGPVEY